MRTFRKDYSHSFTSPLGRYVRGLLRSYVSQGVVDNVEVEMITDAIHARTSELFRDRRLQDRDSRALIRTVAQDVAYDWVKRKMGVDSPVHSPSEPEIQKAIVECVRQWPHETNTEIVERVRRMLMRPGEALYDLSSAADAPSSDLILCAQPRILIASTAIAHRLRASPESVQGLSSREFEILIAEILTDKGWNVHLTPMTRDGGKDMLAYLDSDVGRFLCLVEAKRFAPHHKVGFGIVQRLYGALTSHGATHAMLVTTSAFTMPAKELQMKHQYQLSLREYAHVVKWIREYGGGGEPRVRGMQPPFGA